MEREPRAWLTRPKSFGQARQADCIARPSDPFQQADWVAAGLQNEQAYLALLKIDRLPGHPSLKAVADHPSFPYTYDTLGKCLRGQQWMTIRVHGAILNTISQIGTPSVEGTP